MSLRMIAEADLGIIMEDSHTGFGWDIAVTNPSGVTGNLTGFSNDISQLIDPETGAMVSGRMASVAIRISSLVSLGLELPRGISNGSSNPWLIAFSDIGGVSHTFKVSQSSPDRALGIVTCMLEVFE